MTQNLFHASQLLPLFSLYHLQGYKCCSHWARDQADFFTVKIAHRKSDINAAEYHAWSSSLDKQCCSNSGENPVVLLSKDHNAFLAGDQTEHSSS